MSNLARAVTRTRRTHPDWLSPAPRPHRPVRYKDPGGVVEQLPPFTVTRPAPKRRGGQAAPMSSAIRARHYDRQNGVPGALKPAQYRRWLRKYNRINDPRGLRGDAS
jgi:hypothetical protein